MKVTTECDKTGTNDKQTLTDSWTQRLIEQFY